MSKRRGGGTSPKDIEIEKRRASVATLAVSGRHQKDIAAALGVSVGTINSDIKHLMKSWQESQLFDTDNAKSMDLQRIEIALKGIWMRVIEGNLLAIDRFERLTRLRGEIIGYKVVTDAVDKNWQPITVIEVVKDYGPATIEGESRLIEMDDND
jgi:hypothetical protein